MLDKTTYKIKSWEKKYKNGDKEIKLDKLKIHKSWKKIIRGEMKKDYWKKLNLEKKLKELIENKINVYPWPKLVFNAFNKTPFDEVKVVILGQDPYHQHHKCKVAIRNGGKKMSSIMVPHARTIPLPVIVPQAMGLSFSVPVNIKVPPSLGSIYRNLINFKHIDAFPAHGNLESWAKQGVLLLNTALTVEHGSPNIHKKYWTKFTNNIIKHISDKKDNVVFVLWGSPALSKLKLIDETKHKVVISSHPSGLSCYKPLKTYPAFMKQDQFGLINKYLEELGKDKIDFSI